ncbi:MAG: NifB/NifX family molybdenum-iron cluster-binding protein [Neptuniibacter sp.]
MGKPLLIAVPIENGAIAEHAGRALTWNVFFSETDGFVQYGWQLQLDEDASLHLWHVRDHGGNRHPLHSVDVVVARSAGEGVIRRLLERNTHVYITKQRNPERAAVAYVHGLLDKGHVSDDSACEEGKQKDEEGEQQSEIAL